MQDLPQVSIRIQDFNQSVCSSRIYFAARPLPFSTFNQAKVNMIVFL